MFHDAVNNWFASVFYNMAVKQACIFNYDLLANTQNADISFITKTLQLYMWI